MTCEFWAHVLLFHLWDPQLQIWPLLCLVSFVVWMLAGLSSPSPFKVTWKKTSGKKIACFSYHPHKNTWLMSFPLTHLSFVRLYLFVFIFWVIYFLSLHFTVCSILTWFNPHTIKEGVCLYCHTPSSVLDSTVISGSQYFSHCSQFFLYSFMQLSHGCLWLYLLPQKFRNSVDRDYCAMENKSGKWIYFFVLIHLFKMWNDQAGTEIS